MDRREQDDEQDLETSGSDASSVESEDEESEDAQSLDPDSDELEDEDELEDDDEEAEAASPPPRRQLGPTLIALGGGVWAVAAALRCGAPEPGPALSVSPDAAPAVADAKVDDDRDEEPADEAEPDAEPLVDDAEPEPAAAGAADTPDDPEDEPDEGVLPPEPLPEGWATELSPPKKITYTIRHGGSIKNVANLYKIFHHEITAMNPGKALDSELPPNSKVVVYLREEDGSSQSVGLPSNGTLEGGVPMIEGPGRHLKAIPWKSYGTEHTVSLLDKVLRRWADRGKVQPILVGNMAARKGGRLEPHSTHQSGRDVDLGYPQILPEGEELNWRSMTKQNLDAAENWNLLKLLRSTGQVEVIFIDSSIQKLLYDYAVANGTVPKAELSRWLEYPRSPPRRGALIQHVKGHVDHMHVRFKCQEHESRCRSRSR